MAKRKPLNIDYSDTYVDTWFERDRASVILYKNDGREIMEIWDESVYDLVEDGYLDPRNFHRSAFEYAQTLGIIKD